MSNSTSENLDNAISLRAARSRLGGLAITTVRVISQIFFFALFCFLTLVNTFGIEWFQKRGWPVNLFFNIDPLIALASALSSHRLFAPLSWSLIILIPTLFLGRFFCSWICPFGALHHFIGYAFGPATPAARIKANRYRPVFALKYYLLTFVLVMAAGNLLLNAVRRSRTEPYLIALILAGLLIVTIILIVKAGNSRQPGFRRSVVLVTGILASLYLLALVLFSADTTSLTTLQIGLLDPLCLFQRSVNIAVLPLLDWPLERIYALNPLYQHSTLIGLILLILLAANTIIPRFFCRALCPLGALLGLFSRFSPWRIQRNESRCTSCRLCLTHCQGASQPDTNLRVSECLLCLSCRDICPENALSFSPPHQNIPSTVVTPDLSRRHLMFSVIGAAATLPLARLAGATGRNWNPHVIRPPGSLPEPQFLQTCIKCGQCMRICPTNVLQPAAFEAGLEGIWTPILNNRIGAGCMANCTACSQVCPTASIAPISIERKRGLGPYAHIGPIRLGTAFIDRSRCLPWAMDRPCAVCQEVCPISPKAIFLRRSEHVIRTGPLTVTAATGNTVSTNDAVLQPDLYGTGDFLIEFTAGQRRPIKSNSADTITTPNDQPFSPIPDLGAQFVIKIVLDQPHIDPQLCVGCGICEHECPVSGRRAVRITAENETRSRNRSLFLKS